MKEKLWYKSYAPGVPRTIDYKKVTISQRLSENARRIPRDVIMDYMGRVITFEELDHLVNRFARALTDLGIGRGDKVAVIIPNIPEIIITNMAIWRIGAVAVLINPLYTERELEYQLADSGSKLVVTLSLLIPRIRSIMPKTGVKKIIATQISSFLPFPKKQLFPYVRKAFFKKIEPDDVVFEYEALIKKYSGAPLEEKSRWEELSTLIYTGGTTGVSKGVMLSHRNISSNTQQFEAWFPDFAGTTQSMIANLPIFHSAAFTSHQNLFVWAGWELIMLPRPEPKMIIELLKKHRPTILPGVPTIFVGLLNDPEFRSMDLTFIKGFFSGAAPLALDTIRDLKELTGSLILEIYGLSETSPIITGTPWGGTIKPGTVGVPMPDTDIKIVDLDTGKKEMKTGETGEIIVSGPQVMMSYYKKPDETGNTLRDGWIYTGDIGFFDEDGYLTIVDRKKDMVIAGGYNIYPVEIDNVLFDHPKILEACSVGVPDKYRGETIKAFIVVKPGEALTEREVTDFCKERLAAYKVPKIIEFVDSVPKSAVGKVLRRELRDREIAKMKG